MFEADDGARLIGNSHAFRITCQQVGDKPGHERQMPHDKYRLAPAVALPVEGRRIVVRIDEPAGLDLDTRRNDIGKLTGLEWIHDAGVLVGLIAITNTHSVGVVRDAIVADLTSTADALFPPELKPA